MIYYIPHLTWSTVTPNARNLPCGEMLQGHPCMVGYIGNGLWNWVCHITPKLGPQNRSSTKLMAHGFSDGNYSIFGRLDEQWWNVVKSEPLHPIWKLNAFTCFVAFSWGEKNLEVGACCVQLVFWKLEHWYFYLRSCRFRISLMCQFHWELDCVGFSPFEIWRCGCVEMLRGLVARGSFFPF